MTTEMRNLPLFPLHTVLFPGATIPLQIFEDRYKEMINYCLESDSMFGIVLIKEGDEVGGPAIPHHVGTVAKITNAREISGGRIYISVLGTKRFRINEIVQDTPYLVAEVEVGESEDDPYIPEDELSSIKKAASEYVEHLLTIRGGWATNTPTPPNPVELSYFLAQLLQIDMTKRQDILGNNSCRDRLDACKKYLEQANASLSIQTRLEVNLKFSRH
tara:strand:- start:19484 stop:20134 length:651 start_codon:yes stop_codon:yes gene_type:complete